MNFKNDAANGRRNFFDGNMAPATGRECPTGLGHRFDGDDTVRNAHAQRCGGRPLAAMGNPQDCLVRHADLGLLRFKRNVSSGRYNAGEDERPDEEGTDHSDSHGLHERMRGAGSTTRAITSFRQSLEVRGSNHHAQADVL